MAYQYIFMKPVHNNFFNQQRGLHLPLLLIFFMLLCTGTKAQPPQMLADEVALLQTLRQHTSTGFKLINLENIVEKHGQLLNADRYISDFFAGIKFLEYKQLPYSGYFGKYLSPLLKQYLQDSLPANFYDNLWQSGQPNSKVLWLLLKHATKDTAAVKNYITHKLSKLSGKEEKSFATAQTDLCESLFLTVIQKKFDYDRLYADPEVVALVKYANRDEVYLSFETMAFIKYILIFKSCTSPETLKEIFTDKDELRWQAMVAHAGVSKSLSFAAALPDVLRSKLAMPIKVEVLLHQQKNYPAANLVDSLQSMYRQIPQYYPYSIIKKRDNFEEFREIQITQLAHNTLTTWFLTQPSPYADSCVAALQSGNRYNWDLLANGIKARYAFAPAFLQRHISLLNSVSPGAQADRLDSISDVFIGYGRYESFKPINSYGYDKDSLFEKLFTTPTYFAAVGKTVLNNTTLADSLTNFTVPTLTAMINKGNFLQAGYAWQYILVQKPALLTRVLANATPDNVKQHLFFMANLLQAKDYKKQLTKYFISSFATIAANKNTSNREMDRPHTTQALQYFKNKDSKLFKQFVRKAIADTSGNYYFNVQLLNAYPQYLYNDKVVNTAIRHWYLRLHFAPNNWSNLLPLLNKEDETFFINSLYGAFVSSREWAIKSRLENRF
jgi:hypothetical protein